MIPKADEVQYVRTPSVSRYEGVVLQPNDRWGAQIFIHHQRTFLGFFRSEIAAARANDSASLRVYGEGFFRNFFWTRVTIHEPVFQDHFSRKEILEMIRNGSYEPKFIEFVRMFYPDLSASVPITLPDHSDSFDGVFIKEMFRIELSSVEVERPAILILPDEHAMKHFPQLMSRSREQLVLRFHDRMHRVWEFQFRYSTTNKGYVFDGGWDRFVDEMKLDVKDIVIFYRCKEWRNFPPASRDVIDVIHGVRCRCDLQHDVHVEDRISSVHDNVHVEDRLSSV